MFRKIRKLLLKPLIWLLAIIFLIEEFLWDATGKLMAKLGANRIVHKLETWISGMKAYQAMLVFLMPSATLIPAKLIGLHAIATGHIILGSSVFLVAKVIGMALFSRIFTLTRPALLQLNWFSRLHDKVMEYRNRIHAYLDAWVAYQHIKLRIKLILIKIKGNGRFVKFMRRVSKPVRSK